MDYKRLIANGKSIRDFKSKEVEEKILLEIKNHKDSCKKLVQDIDLEVNFYTNEELYEKIKEVSGYRGNLIKAPNYMFILSEKKDNYLENSGYVGEELILKARNLGVDSCWITFENQDVVKERLGIESEKEITGIIALGYRENVKLSESATGKTRISVDNLVSLDKWENKLSTEDLENRGLAEVFSYTRMAPSTLNRQPWRFLIDGDKIILAIRKDEFASEYECKIDTGIVMLYLSRIIDVTLFESKWDLVHIEGDKYNVPKEYYIAGTLGI